ncbi:MAG: glycosyltransferase family 87 protein [Terracidiphilus sp.]|jgi:hypothetical protein
MDSGNRAPDKSETENRFLRWPSAILGPMPGIQEINLACWSVVAAIFVTRFCLPVWIQYKAGRGSIPLFPNDFVYFYGIGQIAKDFPASRLYDYSLQLKTFNEIYQLPARAYGPSPYPPFVALFFSLFARVSFRVAFFAWTVCSLLLYCMGITAAARDFFPRDRVKISLILCLAIAFYPFFWGIVVNGQLSAVAVCALGITVYLERRSKLFQSGLALSVLAYKPTLLLLLVPMLFLTRRFKTLAGFAAGAAALTLLGTAFGGIAIWPEFMRFLKLFGQLTGMNAQSSLLLYKFVDLNSFLLAMGGGRSTPEMAIFALITISIGTVLGVLLWKSAKGGWPVQSLAWATTITWTLLLNVYVPMYDSVLVALAAVLAFGAVKENGWSAAINWVASISVSIFAVSWVSYDIARDRHIQLLSLAIAFFGLVELYILHRMIGRGKQLEPASIAQAKGLSKGTPG